VGGVGIAPAGEDSESLGGKLFRNGGADEIAAADDRGCGIAFGQFGPPLRRRTFCAEVRDILRHLSR